MPNMKQTRPGILTAKCKPSLGKAVAQAAKRSGRSISGFIRFAVAEQCVKDGVSVDPEDVAPPDAEAESE